MLLSTLMHKYVSVVSEIASLMILSGIFFILVFTVVLISLKLWIGWRSKSLLPHLRKDAQGRTLTTVGFFHPYCNAGGGGERVLWTAIRALQKKYPSIQCVIYTGDVDARPADIIDRARQRFNIVIVRPVEFVYLYRRDWVEAFKYPYFTLLGQSLGSVFLGWEAMMKFVPDIYLETMGYAFTGPLFKYFGGCKVGAYTHYPTISTDMIDRVSHRSRTYNNATFISGSLLLSAVKLAYYRLFAYLYGIVGKRFDLIMVNSTWTFNHIEALWQASDKTHIVYPPCDVTEFVKLPLERGGDKTILSVGQFRPEKDHPLQIESFSVFLKRMGDSERRAYKLCLVGSCRHDSDVERVNNLREFCEELGVADRVQFKLNVSFTELKQLMGSSTVGLHTMWNEHFGIGIVELMAAGCIGLAHNSGGPKLDIVIPHNGEQTGFLADDVPSYADAMETIFNMSDKERLKIQMNARESVQKFSDEEFECSFLTLMEPMLQNGEEKV
ncbi:GDP-Man:Man(3)GlcNAc(2)-PP-Dol alpha-1,2-mannosyltransferase-like isoform X2 [Gigantopelta aegis]|uniref:GDP-Man:Man(3)GlcNAc(2)-PP-Dol alpha-1,2-mannosyltransferase-like isoform X2 n=1 Tax=Gigantopelta aegis TaxID=1735272 RepID=UPI001B88884B|nr:GDP-Man:Man(3)GlcNAc(2)-PP-Dol alpha-1,2-mannosyltransferase-like isoform X2 [Gigantopelta aegis]